MSKPKMTRVMVSLDERPAQGYMQTVFRTKEGDKKDVAKAARLLDMSAAQFIRTVTVSAARRVISELT